MYGVVDSMAVLLCREFRGEHPGIQKHKLAGFCLLGYLFAICHQSKMAVHVEQAHRRYPMTAPSGRTFSHPRPEMRRITSPAII